MAEEMNEYIIELKSASIIEDYYTFDFSLPNKIKFVPGQIWMHVLSHDRHVAYDNQPSS